MKAFALALVVVCAFPAPAEGQAVASNNAVARGHFREGLLHAERGNLLQALHEFEAAYAAQPNFSVLYNIGQAQSALGHPVEATATFERYLAEGGEQIGASRREEVAAILATNRGRIGALELVAPPTARIRVWLDGSEIPADRLRQPITLAAGEHSVLSFEEGCSPSVQTPIVPVGSTLALQVPRGTSCKKPLGQLEIDCEVPDVNVDVAGVLKTKTPLERPLLAPVGETLVLFQRAGYGRVSRSVRVSHDQLTRVACEQRPIEPLPPSLAARLVVDRSPADARVLVDGQPFTGGPIPFGTHQVVVEREGFQPARRLASLEARKTLVMSTTLQKDARSIALAQASASGRKKVALVIGVVGLGFLGTAGGLYAWNTGRYTDWRDRSASAGQGDLGLATSVQRVDDLTLAFAVLGAGLTGASAWLFLVAE
jgi:hypothetical protein